MTYKEAFAATNVPDGTLGIARVESFSISEQDAKMENLRSAINGRGYSRIKPGDYKKLYVGGTLMMSDTPMEYRTNFEAMIAARGDVLVMGLGLGCLLRSILTKDCVDTVTVLEKHQDVIDLVGPTITDPRVSIICADAFDWKWPKGQKFDYVWHDIWPDICWVNKEQMTKLKRRYGRLSGGNQDCWSEELIR